MTDPITADRDPRQRKENVGGPAIAAHFAQPPAPAATAETLRDAAQGQVVAWSARAASLRMLRSERAIGEAIGLAQAAAELDAIVLTVPDAARAEPLDVERFRATMHRHFGSHVDGAPVHESGCVVCAAYEEARRRG